MASNLKGWIGFVVVAIIITGGAFGTSHILKTSTTGTEISGMSAHGIAGYYNSTNQTYVANVSQNAISANFTVSIKLTQASGGLNISVIAPSILNQSAYNATFSSFYNKIYNESVNQTVSSGVKLNASINASLAENATRLASIYANQNLTYELFPSEFTNVQYSGGLYTLNLTVNFNETALSLMKPGQSLFAVINAAAGSSSANAFVMFTKV